jgi:hypothetical protein
MNPGKYLHREFHMGGSLKEGIRVRGLDGGRVHERAGGGPEGGFDYGERRGEK